LGDRNPQRTGDGQRRFLLTVGAASDRSVDGAKGSASLQGRRTPLAARVGPDDLRSAGCLRWFTIKDQQRCCDVVRSPWWFPPESSWDGATVEGPPRRRLPPAPVMTRPRSPRRPGPRT